MGPAHFLGAPLAQDHLLTGLRRRLQEQEERRLSPLACPSRRALRRRSDPLAEQGHRLPFAVDADRVLHSLAYTRYIDKTQVFSLVDNDQISHRVLHVQLVSKIARGLGRMLGLNEDLIEAIALAHDLGHPPFGHDGERFLSAKCLEHGLGPFMHNLQSVHFLERLERGGRGLNLSLQVLDGVLTHDGEIHTVDLSPSRGKDFATLEAQMAAKRADPSLELLPMTLEGCLVRVADSIAYVGRDLEDAIVLGLVSRDMLPSEVREVLGESNGTIVYRLVEDVAAASLDHDRISFSPTVAQALGRLKAFNLEYIYTNPAIKTEHPKIAAAFDLLFERYLDDLRSHRLESPVYRDFLDRLDPAYKDETPPGGVVRDFLAGMTDEFFLKRHAELVSPRRLPGQLNTVHST
ncbi:MAG: HD domain-containing protein [Proteobacteria bacterium]|nr:HD domain-containing protein [Pseudomonadota bacterium]MBU2468579.1 HD domain-containing protein [Pseudomonadota bacterium]